MGFAQIDISPWAVAAQAGQAVVGAGSEYIKSKVAADLAKAALMIPPPEPSEEPTPEPPKTPVEEEEAAMPEATYVGEESPWYLSPIVLVGAAAAAYFLFLRK
jgi:hypothetical protein